MLNAAVCEPASLARSGGHGPSACDVLAQRVGLASCLTIPRSERYVRPETRRARQAESAPTGGAIDMLSSLRMTISREFIRALGEGGQPAALRQGAGAVALTGQNLVRIGLEPHIPHQAVPRIEDIVQCDRQLYYSQPSPRVPAGDRDRADGLRPQLVGHLSQILLANAAQVAWASTQVTWASNPVMVSRRGVGRVMTRTTSHRGSPATQAQG
jgi:hypothetical protein